MKRKDGLTSGGAQSISVYCAPVPDDTSSAITVGRVDKIYSGV